MLDRERESGLFSPDGFSDLQAAADAAAHWLQTLVGDHDDDARLIGYGAAAKGTTLLNHARVDAGGITAVVDRNPAKQGRQMPGTGIPILPPEAIDELLPATVLILPWNLREEVESELARIRAWGGRFAIPMPQGEVW